MSEPEVNFEEESAPRKRKFSKLEALQKLKDCENNINLAASEIVADLTPFDVTNDCDNELEVKLEKIDKVTDLLKKRIWKLKDQMKQRKYRHSQKLLEDDIISCSQHSVLQSEPDDDLSLSFSQQSLEEGESAAKPRNSYRYVPVFQYEYIYVSFHFL